jgi:hypothetical protein
MRIMGKMYTAQTGMGATRRTLAYYWWKWWNGKSAPQRGIKFK